MSVMLIVVRPCGGITCQGRASVMRYMVAPTPTVLFVALKCQQRRQANTATFQLMFGPLVNCQ